MHPQSNATILTLSEVNEAIAKLNSQNPNFGTSEQKNIKPATDEQPKRRETPPDDVQAFTSNLFHRN